MFVDVHPRLTLSLQRWAEPPQNDMVEKPIKLFIFRFSGATENT